MNTHTKAHTYFRIWIIICSCAHTAGLYNRVLASNPHLRFQLANERKCAVLQWRPWPMCIFGIGKMVAQRRTLPIPVTSGCNRWSGPIAVYQILSYKCMHGIINWTLISSETNLEEQLHLFPWWQGYKRLILNHAEKQGAKGTQQKLQSMKDMQKCTADLMNRCRHHSRWLGHIQFQIWRAGMHIYSTNTLTQIHFMI